MLFIFFQNVSRPCLCWFPMSLSSFACSFCSFDLVYIIVARFPDCIHFFFFCCFLGPFYFASFQLCFFLDCLHARCSAFCWHCGSYCVSHVLHVQLLISGLHVIRFWLMPPDMFGPLVLVLFSCLFLVVIWFSWMFTFLMRQRYFARFGIFDDMEAARAVFAGACFWGRHVLFSILIYILVAI